MTNLEVLDKVKALLSKAIQVMDENENVFTDETIDVEDLYHTLDNLVFGISFSMNHLMQISDESK